MRDGEEGKNLQSLKKSNLYLKKRNQNQVCSGQIIKNLILIFLFYFLY